MGRARVTRDAALLALIAILPHYEAPDGTRLGIIRVHAVHAAFETRLLLDNAQPGIARRRRFEAIEELVRLLYPLAFPDRAGEVS